MTLSDRDRDTIRRYCVMLGNRNPDAEVAGFEERINRNVSVEGGDYARACGALFSMLGHALDEFRRSHQAARAAAIPAPGLVSPSLASPGAPSLREQSLRLYDVAMRLDRVTATEVRKIADAVADVANQLDPEASRESA